MKKIDGKISVIMPAHNEAIMIKANVRLTIETLKSFETDFEIILIDDGSNDDTWSKINELAKEFSNIKVTRNMQNYGKGRAIKKGFRLADGHYIVFLDSDIDLHPAQLDTFFDIMRFDNADVVIGSKRHPNSVLNYPLHRKIVSTIYFFLIKIMFGLPIRDTQTGLKLFKMEVLKRVFPKILVKAFAFDLEILANAHRLGYKIAEAPIHINTQSKFDRIRIRDMIDTGIDTLAIFYRMRFRRSYYKDM